jgi:hypothetical protein
VKSRAAAFSSSFSRSGPSCEPARSAVCDRLRLSWLVVMVGVLPARQSKLVEVGQASKRTAFQVLVRLAFRVRDVGRHGPLVAGPLAVQAAGEQVLVLGVLGQDRLHRAEGQRGGDDGVVDQGEGRAGGVIVAVVPAGVGAVAPVPVAPIVGAPDRLVLDLADLDLRIEGVGLQFEIVGGLVLQAARNAGALLVDAAGRHLRAPRRVVDLAVAVQVAAVVAGARGRTGVGVVVAPARERAVAVLLALAGHAQDDGQVVVDLVNPRTRGAVAGRGIVRDVLAAVVEHRAGAQHEFGTLVVERGDRIDVDGRGHAAGDQVGRLRLVDLHAGDDFRRIDFPADVAVGLAGGDFAIVDGAQHQARAKAAHDGLAVIAAVARGVDARQARDRLGDGHVGQDADVLGRDGLDDLVGALLDGQRVAQALANAGDDDFLDLGGLLRRSGLSVDAGRGGQGETAGGGEQKGVASHEFPQLRCAAPRWTQLLCDFDGLGQRGHPLDSRAQANAKVMSRL